MTAEQMAKLTEQVLARYREELIAARPRTRSTPMTTDLAPVRAGSR
jgi:hypothetical protein